MYETLPTIRIKHPDGYAIINVSDFDPSIHAAFDSAPASDGVAIAKGPRGKWFVSIGGERQSHGYDTEAEAVASIGG